MNTVNMSLMKFLSCLVTPLLILSLAQTHAVAQKNEQLVRLAIIEVDTSQLVRYNHFLQEEIRASIEKEPGVITLFGVAEKARPERITLFETYADSAQYKAHLVTTHFQTYKQGTLQMVKHLELIAMESILYVRKSTLAKARVDDLVIRLIKMEIDSGHIASFRKLAESTMLPGIETEPGVLVMYAVAAKDRPTDISILEVYCDSVAYEKHLKSPHFLKYKAASKDMVKSIQLIDVIPILLGSRPQK